MNATQKTMEILVSSERVADRILQNKQEIVQLDRRRQETREALRELRRGMVPGGGGGKSAWVTIGSMLVKLPNAKALEMLQKDQVQIDAEINKLRSDQKVLVCELRDLELMDPLRGHDLRPLRSDEIAGIRANLPGF